MNFKIHIPKGKIKKWVRFAPKQKAEKNQKAYDRKKKERYD